MSERVAFGPTLSRLRRDQGFSTPYAFFKAGGGARVLGLTFPNYLKLERGSSVPKTATFRRILGGLGLRPGARGRAVLVRAYLAAVLGDDDLLDELDAPADRSSPSQEAALLAVRQRASNYDLDQWSALASSDEARICGTYLVNTPGFSAVEKIARATGLPRGRTQAALKSLAKVKLIELDGGRARHLFARKVVNALPVQSATVAVRARLRRSAVGMIERAPLTYEDYIFARMRRPDVQRYTRHLEESLWLAAAYGDVDEGEDSEVYAVRATVSRLFP